LIGENLSQGKDNHLSSLEIFIILTAILWHDAGMVYGRSGHADQVVRVIAKIKEVCLPDVTIRRIVTEIVQSHSGQQGLKIPKREEDCTGPSLGACTIYPKALAALIRFADEISENRSRISGALLGDVPEDQSIFWEYANCVTAARPDPARHRVVLSLEIPYDKAIQDYKCKEFKGLRGNTGEISLIEYIVRRIEKMNNERAYCAPHFNKYAWIGEICVRFKITNGIQGLDAFEIENNFGDPDSAIPSIDIFERFFDENPEWRPDQLKRKKSP